MEDLIEITTVLSKIKETYLNIFIKAAKLKSKLSEEIEDYLEEITERADVNLSKENLLLVSNQIIESLTKDAEAVHSDLPKFAESFQKGGTTSLEKIDSEFFQQIWLGDMYGEEGAKGLLALLKDLENQCGQLDEDEFINILVNKFKNSTSGKSEMSGGLWSLLGL